MRPLLRPLTALALLCALHGTARAVRPGDLDPGFGDGGTIRIPVSEGVAHAVLVLPDGSLLVGGTGDPEGDGVTKFLLARVDAAGSVAGTPRRDASRLARSRLACARGVGIVALRHPSRAWVRAYCRKSAWPSLACGSLASQSP